MPWTPSDASRYDKQANTSAKRRKWARIANHVLRSYLDRGRSRGDAERLAIMTANSLIESDADVRAAERRFKQLRDPESRDRWMAQLRRNPGLLEPEVRKAAKEVDDAFDRLHDAERDRLQHHQIFFGTRTDRATTDELHQSHKQAVSDWNRAAGHLRAFSQAGVNSGEYLAPVTRHSGEHNHQRTMDKLKTFYSGELPEPPDPYKPGGTLRGSASLGVIQTMLPVSDRALDYWAGFDDHSTARDFGRAVGRVLPSHELDYVNRSYGGRYMAFIRSRPRYRAESLMGTPVLAKRSLTGLERQHKAIVSGLKRRLAAATTMAEPRREVQVASIDLDRTRLVCEGVKRLARLIGARLKRERIDLPPPETVPRGQVVRTPDDISGRQTIYTQGRLIGTAEPLRVLGDPSLTSRVVFKTGRQTKPHGIEDEERRQREANLARAEAAMRAREQQLGRRSLVGHDPTSTAVIEPPPPPTERRRPITQRLKRTDLAGK